MAKGEVVLNRDVIVTVKKGESPQTFHDIRYISLIGLIAEINKRGLSLEEAEEQALVEPGKILQALQINGTLPRLDMCKFGMWFM